MAFDYKSYLRANVKNAEPGYSPEVWMAPLSEFLVLQEPVLPGVAAGDTVRITQAHTFAAGKGFVRFECAPDSVTGDGTLIGPKGAKRTRFNPQIILQGDSPEQLEMIKAMANENMIVILKDATCPGGQLVQFGCDCTPVNVNEGQFTSSNTGDDQGQKAWTLTLQANCKYFYDAAVTEKTVA